MFSKCILLFNLDYVPVPVYIMTQIQTSSMFWKLCSLSCRNDGIYPNRLQGKNLGKEYKLRDNNSLEQCIIYFIPFCILSGTGHLLLQCLTGTGSQIHLFFSGTGSESRGLRGTRSYF